MESPGPSNTSPVTETRKLSAMRGLNSSQQTHRRNDVLTIAHGQTGTERHLLRSFCRPSSVPLPLLPLLLPRSPAHTRSACGDLAGAVHPTFAPRHTHAGRLMKHVHLFCRLAVKRTQAILPNAHSIHAEGVCSMRSRPPFSDLSAQSARVLQTGTTRCHASHTRRLRMLSLTNRYGHAAVLCCAELQVILKGCI